MTLDASILPATGVGVVGGLLVGLTGVGAGSVIAALLLLLYPDVAAQIIVFVFALCGNQGALMMLLAFLGYQFVFRMVVGSIMIAVHRESYKPLHAIPFLDLYGSFLLGSAFVISIIDELFGLRMRW